MNKDSLDTIAEAQNTTPELRDLYEKMKADAKAHKRALVSALALRRPPPRAAYNMALASYRAYWAEVARVHGGEPNLSAE